MKKCVKAYLFFMCIGVHLSGCSAQNGFNGKNKENSKKEQSAKTAAAEIQSTPQIETKITPPIEKPVTPQTQDQLPAEKVVAVSSI